MEEEDYNVLRAIEDLLETERSFHQTIRFFDSTNRSQLTALHLRNTSVLLGILRQYMSHSDHVQRNTINIPINLDAAGMIAASFLDPVPVVPTQAQITSATESGISVTDTTCAICQEEVTTATRIRHCQHCFHSNCISEWFSMNTRCPVCRHDIRDLQRNNVANINVNRRGHANE